MKIIRLEYADFDNWSTAIAKLLVASVEANFQPCIVPKNYYTDKCTELKEYVRENKATVFLAIDGKALAGVIWICEIYRFDAKCIHIVHFAVALQYRGRNIGGELLSSVEDYATVRHISDIDLMVTAQNTDAVNFYRNKGFSSERYLMHKGICNHDY